MLFQKGLALDLKKILVILISLNIGALFIIILFGYYPCVCKFWVPNPHGYSRVISKKNQNFELYGYPTRKYPWNSDTNQPNPYLKFGPGITLGYPNFGYPIPTLQGRLENSVSLGQFGEIFRWFFWHFFDDFFYNLFDDFLTIFSNTFLTIFWRFSNLFHSVWTLVLSIFSITAHSVRRKKSEVKSEGSHGRLGNSVSLGQFDEIFSQFFLKIFWWFFWRFFDDFFDNFFDDFLTIFLTIFKSVLIGFNSDAK